MQRIKFSAHLTVIFLLFMNKHDQGIDINNIRVASPCPVSWDSMHGDDRSRRCDQCSLMVYNISGLKNVEVANLIQKSDKERVCIRLRRRTDGTVITKECPKGLAAYRKRVGVLAGTAFAAVLSLFSVASGQRPPSNDSQGTRSETSVNTSMIEGMIKDTEGAVIPGAVITVTNSGGRSIMSKSDRRGRFRLRSIDSGSRQNTLKIEAKGFNPFVDHFSISLRELIYFPVTLSVGAMTGVIEVRNPPTIDPRKSETSTTFRISDR